MNYVHLGLLSEGSTDRRVIPIFLDKAMHALRTCEKPRRDFEWSVDTSLGVGSSENIDRQIRAGNHDIYLVHQDGAQQAAQVLKRIRSFGDYVVPVVPVYEVEAWLLGDTDALPRAVGAPAECGLEPIHPGAVEAIRDPKAELHARLEHCLGQRVDPREDGIEGWYELIAEQASVHKLNQVRQFRVFASDLRDSLKHLGWPF